MRAWARIRVTARACAQWASQNIRLEHGGAALVAACAAGGLVLCEDARPPPVLGSGDTATTTRIPVDFLIVSWQHDPLSVQSAAAAAAALRRHGVEHAHSDVHAQAGTGSKRRDDRSWWSPWRAEASSPLRMLTVQVSDPSQRASVRACTCVRECVCAAAQPMLICDACTGMRLSMSPSSRAAAFSGCRVSHPASASPPAPLEHVRVAPSRVLLCMPTRPPHATEVVDATEVPPARSQAEITPTSGGFYWFDPALPHTDVPPGSVVIGDSMNALRLVHTACVAAAARMDAERASRMPHIRWILPHARVCAHILPLAPGSVLNGRLRKRGVGLLPFTRAQYVAPKLAAEGGDGGFIVHTAATYDRLLTAAHEAAHVVLAPDTQQWEADADLIRDGDVLQATSLVYRHGASLLPTSNDFSIGHGVWLAGPAMPYADASSRLAAHSPRDVQHAHRSGEYAAASMLAATGVDVSGFDAAYTHTPSVSLSLPRLGARITTVGSVSPDARSAQFEFYTGHALARESSDSPISAVLRSRSSGRRRHDAAIGVTLFLHPRSNMVDVRVAGAAAWQLDGAGVSTMDEAAWRGFCDAFAAQAQALIQRTCEHPLHVSDTSTSQELLHLVAASILHRACAAQQRDAKLASTTIGASVALPYSCAWYVPGKPVAAAQT